MKTPGQLDGGAASEARSAGVGRSGGLALAATTGVQVTAVLAGFTLAAIAPEVAADLEVPPAFIGYQVSLVFGGAIGPALLGGALTRRWGVCRVSQASMFLVGAGSLVTAVPAAAAVALGSLLLGLGFGAINPAASHLLVRLTSLRRRNLVFSVKQTGVPLGGALAGLIAPPIAANFGWQWAPAAVAVLAFLMAAALQPLRAAWDDDRDPAARLLGSSLHGLSMFWRQPALGWVAIVSFWFSVIQLCLITFLVILLVEEVGLSLLEAGFLLSLVNLAGVVGRLSLGSAADRLGDALAILAVLGLLVTACALVTSTLSAAWPVAAIRAMFVIFGFAAMGWGGVFMAEVARLAPLERVGAATGISTAINFAGILVGPAAFAALYGLVGSYAATFAVLALAGLAATASAVLARLASRRGAG